MLQVKTRSAEDVAYIGPQSDEEEYNQWRTVLDTRRILQLRIWRKMINMEVCSDLSFPEFRPSRLRLIRLRI